MPRRTNDSYFVSSAFIGLIGPAACRSKFDMIRGGARQRGAEIAPQPCIRLIRADRNHDAVMRIGGETPGQRAQSAQRLSKPWFYIGSPLPRIHQQT